MYGRGYEKNGDSLPKKRKSILKRSLAVVMNGDIIINLYFDDNTSGCVRFIENVRGPWQVFSVIVQELAVSRYFGICFEQGVGIIGEVDKAKGKLLYQKMIEAGIIFSAQVNRQQVAELLYETFAAQIVYTEDKLELSSLAGWYKGKFQRAETFPFQKAAEFQQFPVLRKHLPEVQADGAWWKTYFHEMKKIASWKDRCFVMLFQFAGVTQTLLQEEGCPFRNIINFVILKEFPRKTICQWLQVFNREEMRLMAVEASEKIWGEMLAESKDENFIVDFSVPDGSSKYMRNKTAQRQNRLLGIVLDGQPISGGAGFKSALVMLSGDVCLRRPVYNAFVDGEFFKNDLDVEAGDAEKSVGILLNRFLTYCEEELFEVRRIMRSVGRNNENAGLEAVWKVMEQFWKSEGIDIYKEAEIPQKPDFSKIIEDQKQDAEEICQYFKKAVRKSARSYIFWEKADSLPLGSEIRYDKNFLWFPPSVLNEILKESGLHKFKPEILLRLKQEGVLRTDPEGFTRKLQIENERKERYQFERKFFTAAGDVEIVRLGKEKSYA